MKPGMWLNFNWDCGKQLEGLPSPYRTCIEMVATHEFGHALGFTHEQNRLDAPAWCRELADDPYPGIYMTPYDPDSIMNYCHTGYATNGNLSEHDIAGLRAWYGPNPSSGAAWHQECRYNTIIFTKNGILQIRGSMQELSIENFNGDALLICVPAGYQVIAYDGVNFQGTPVKLDGPIMWAIPNGARPVYSLKMSDIRSGQSVSRLRALRRQARHRVVQGDAFPGRPAERSRLDEPD